MKRSLRSSCAVAVAVVFGSLIGAGLVAAQTPPWVALPDGELDPRFGSGGIAITAGSEGVPPVAAIQPDGRIVVGAGGLNLGVGFGVLARYNVDGSVDDTFGSGGVVTNAFGGRGAITFQPDGKLLTLARNSYKQLVRYNGDGSLDADFGSGGVVTSPWPICSFALGADGRIVVAGNLTPTTGTIVLARYLANGSLDSTFDTDGRVTLDIPGDDDFASAVAIQSDGKIVVAGEGIGPDSDLRQDFLLVRLNQAGARDAAFGDNGVVFTDFDFRIDRASSLLLLPDGRIVAGGWIGAYRVETPWDFGLARYLANGSLDGTFGVGGKVRTRLPAPPGMDNSSSIARLALQPDGKIVAAGTRQPLTDVPDLAVVRYNSDGTVDQGFGIGGIVITDIGDRAESASDVLIQPDGQIVVAATAGGAGDQGCSCNGVLVLARYRSDSARGVFGGGLRPVPGRIEARDYDLGGQGIGYFDTTPGHDQGSLLYRSDDVDIKLSYAGPDAVGWITAGEWLAYTIDTEHAGVYTIKVRVVSAFADRTFHLEVDGVDVSGQLAVPQREDWDDYQTVVIPGVHLSGRQKLRVVMGSEDFMDFQSIEVVP